MTWAFVVLLLAGVLAACGGGGDSGSESADSAARAPAATSGDRDAGAGSAERAPEGAGEGAGAGAGPGAEKPRAPLTAAREVVHTASLRVRAEDVNASAAKAKQLVTGAGGYVERESSRTEPPRSEITLKIPADRYGELLNTLGTQLGTKLSLSQEAEDVTGEVADVAARVRSAEASLASFRKLYERADSIDEIIRLENEISERESDLEALQAREKSLKNRTQFATVTVTLVSKDAPKEPEDDSRGGFLGGLESGWDAFTAFVGGVAMVFGWLLPFLLTAAVLGLPVLAFLRRRRGRVSTVAPAAGGSGPRPEQDKPEQQEAAGPSGG
ncbi:DUF4349 domain-containing protein [Actinomadura livida]|uniref:Putative lipid-binding transport protein (Tim44 family) n=1 Tax=Actinomadura livida TaxID=79909 RepID=A0A7W7IC12_9ACTN|nr:MULTISPECIES: DUF4349 domain-containing protein [Actinomadura]MBB4774241.1 putative lipid-binding transport protein (Tim44 family) [Actinomadura catellatispora]GGT83956.1 hypothetical protein GCM10010208_03100 [Actinomadura livida]